MKRFIGLKNALKNENREYHYKLNILAEDPNSKFVPEALPRCGSHYIC